MVINLKSKLWFVLIALFFIIAGVGIFFISRNNSRPNDYTASKSSTNNEITNSTTTNNSNNSNNNENIQNNIQNIEEEISTFSTKIYNLEYERQNNITITCNTLNDTIVSNGDTFSFCNTVGKATSERGYLEADIFDKNGKKIKGIGGGNCQVSTTLYNAILQVPQLVVTERHEHSNKVPYIQNGKDAAVAYDSYDLKFVNNYGYDIKIKAENFTNSIKITLYKVRTNRNPLTLV